MRTILYITSFLSITLLTNGQHFSLLPPVPDSLFLRIQFPENDSLLWNNARIRFGGRTHPSAKVFVNSKPVNVYPTGAFAGVVSIQQGRNTLRFTTISQRGDSLWKEYTIIRPEPPSPLPHDTLIIDETSIEPSTDLWLTTGDVLEVKMKASPGWEAYFDIPGVASDIPMMELPSRDGTPSGMYIGRYTVQPTDRTSETPLTVYLVKGFWNKEKAQSKGRISFYTTELPRVAEIVGKRVPLNAGISTTRLGGEKYGFLHEGTRIIITGKVGNFYRVRLANSFTAWVPIENVKLLPASTPFPQSNVGSITTTGNSTHDLITVNLDTKLPITSEQSLQPMAILIHIWGATTNNTWIAHGPSVKGIASITCTQVEDNHVLLTVSLRSNYHWGYDIEYSGTTLRIRVARPPVVKSKSMPLSALTIALDAGHGGTENHGAVGATGVFEKDITLALVTELQKELTAKGATVIVTRTGDQHIPTAERIEPIVRSNAQLLLSIHCNSCGDASDPLAIRGTSVYYKHIGFKPLADIVFQKLLSTGLQPYGVIGNFNFLLNALTQVPNILIETAFLSHPEEEMLLLQDDFRQTLVKQLAIGIEEYIKLASDQR
ncbi:MAG: N-acetylmuramoyl-L-alanine amidase [Bacteroidetes bacterium]|nr:N-acetylmuramoyl-L-alanine amidase [Bacteroidota bacterium]